MITLLSRKRESYSDIEVVEGLQRKNPRVEEWFYRTAEKYFSTHFNVVFFDKDKKQEIFQSAFIKLWTEIENKRIKSDGDKLLRQQRDGAYEAMTCSLTTFLMAFAKTEYRELVRNVNEDCYESIYDSAQYDSCFELQACEAEDTEEMKNRIVDECIMQMSPACIDIITLFYHKGKSLDEILEIRNEKNTSKNGLKSAKNKCMNTLRKRVLAEYKINCL